VTLVESSAPPTASLSGGRSFSYLIGPRGAAALDRVPALLPAIRATGVPSRPLAITSLAADGSVTVNSDMGKSLQSRTAAMQPGSWLHRNAFMRLLYEQLDAAAAVGGGHLTVRTDTACVGLAPPVVLTDDDGVPVGGGDTDRRALLTLRNKHTGEEEVVRPDLVIGADGVRSLVRNALGGALGYGDPADFTRHYPSPAAKVAYRTLALLPCPPLNADGSMTAEPHMMYVCRGKAFNLGLLCVGSDPTLPRIGTVTRLAADPIWQLRTVDEYWAAFEDNFPHLPLRQMVAPGAMEAFAAGTTVSFPTPTMPEALGGGVGATGVALVGDAAHTFPPDLGQGVNAALEDVGILVDLLAEHAAAGRSSGDGGGDGGGGTTPSQAVDPTAVAAAYHAARRDDVAALIRLMQVGAPYQYGQDKVRQALWGVSLLGRVKLANAAPGVFAAPIFTAVNTTDGYAAIWRRERETRRRVMGGVLAVAAAVVAAIVR